MSSVRLSGVSYAWTSSVPVLDGVDLHLSAGFTGVVGPNGGGKSTLLALLAGRIAPDRGSVRWDPRGARVAFVAQELDPGDPNGSPGERRNRQVSRALATDPDAILLDEPTNHLDGPARRDLIRQLRRFAGVGVVVSHDRALLDALTTSTVRVRPSGVDVFPGRYSEAREAWEAERQRILDDWETADRARKTAARRLADERRHHDHLDAMRSSGARMKSVKDHDARGSLAKYNLGKADARSGHRVGVLRAELGRREEELGGIEIDAELGRPLVLDFAPSPKARVAWLHGALSAHGRVVLEDVDVVVGRTDRVHVAGPNGAGKTTLLTALWDVVDRDDAVYVPQELGDDEIRADLELVRGLPGDVRGRVMNAVAALGVDPGRLLRTERPSPGEARKLRIALAIGRRVGTLLLDEPTNHLDLPSVERLEAALATWPGALVLVTHDDALARKVCARRWRLEGSALHDEQVQ